MLISEVRLVSESHLVLIMSLQCITMLPPISTIFTFSSRAEFAHFPRASRFARKVGKRYLTPSRRQPRYARYCTLESSLTRLQLRLIVITNRMFYAIRNVRLSLYHFLPQSQISSRPDYFLPDILPVRIVCG